MKNPHSIVEQPVEDFVRIPKEGHDTHTPPLNDLLRRLRMFGDVRNNSADACFDRSRDGFAEYKAVGR
jgi:hypothetical protein